MPETRRDRVAQFTEHLNQLIRKEAAANPEAMNDICPACGESFIPRSLPDLYHSPCCGAELTLEETELEDGEPS